MGEANQMAKRNMRVLATCLGVVVGMGGLAFASVPLYRIFCQVTGFGGTTQVADAAPDVVLDRVVTVRFDANISPDLAWEFEPVQVSQTLRIGEVGLAFFRSTNLGDTASTGVATFNVTPLAAGIYFQKIQCFCFSEQTLQAGEEALMPVYYYVDPAIAETPRLDYISTITLSYTFFPTETPQYPVGASAEVSPQQRADVAFEPNMGHTEP